jgi:hypothetical protein
MRITRLLLLVVAAAAIAGISVPAANALAFPDSPCPVNNGGTVKICPQGQTGKPYSLQLQGREGTGCVPYVSFKADGSLPAGLTLSSSGLISGTPTQVGESIFWVEMTDIPASQGGPSWCNENPPNSTQRQFSISIVQGLQIQQRQSTLTPAQLNTNYNLQFSASGGSPTWAVSSGALPPGLTLSSSGLLSGTPTTQGDYGFKITASDGSRSDTQTYSISVVPKLQISGAPRGVAEAGVPFQLAPSATGGKPAYSWSLDGGTTLPAGLSLDAASGAISGTPAAPGHATVQLRVTDSLGLTSTLNVSFTVVPHLLLAKKTLRAATAGAAYSALIAKTGGARPFKWTISGGPQGLKLNARGQLSGTPRKAGTYRLKVKVTDALGAASTRTYVLKVTG